MLLVQGSLCAWVIVASRVHQSQLLKQPPWAPRLETLLDHETSQAQCAMSSGQHGGRAEGTSFFVQSMQPNNEGIV